MPPSNSDEQLSKLLAQEGKKPAEHIPHLQESERNDFMARNRHICRWKQQGNRIFCDVLEELVHGKQISTNLLLKGTDSHGLPILENVVLSK